MEMCAIMYTDFSPNLQHFFLPISLYYEFSFFRANNSLSHLAAALME